MKANRTTLRKTEQFLIGDKQEGHAVYRSGKFCASTVWNDGVRVRTDFWPDCQTAKRYAYGRAERHGTYDKRALRKAGEKHGLR